MEFPYELGDYRVSDSVVLQSAAGWYIGRMSDDGIPFMRESGYYANKYIAQTDLDEGTWEVRYAPENEMAYSQGIPRPLTQAEIQPSF